MTGLTAEILAWPNPGLDPCATSSMADRDQETPAGPERTSP
jgi:hypothetical protein